MSPTGAVQRVLVVTAHPDDVDFGAAGTIASWTAKGIEVAYCICTSGDAGGFDNTPRAEMPALRQAEQRAAAAAVGVTDVTFLDYPDGALEPSMALRRDITRQIRTFRPDRVVTQSPEINYTRIAASHPDHLATGRAALAAVYPDARNRFAHPELLADEGLDEWTVGEVWLIAAPSQLINQVVDITDTFAAKVDALRAHRSQTSHWEDLAGALAKSFGRLAVHHGLPEGHQAEAFQVVDTR